MLGERIQPGILLFPTALGAAALAWTRLGVDQLELPAAAPEAVRARIRRRSPDRSEVGRAPAPIARIAARVGNHLLGRLDDLRDIPLDLGSAGEFAREVYAALRAIGPGELVTYGELAALAGRPKAARAVGRALGANPIPLIVPCHRVLTAAGTLGGFSAAGGTELKARLLELEGIRFVD